MHKHGYKPIIITRNWDRKIESPDDVLKSSGDAVIHEVNQAYEVFYLPYKASLRDRLYAKGGTFSKMISRALTFFQLIAENFTTRVIPHRNLYDFTRNYLNNNPEIKKLIISGNPFDQFSFGYQLKKRCNISWIADYRDDWNTSEVDVRRSGLWKLVHSLHSKSEKKWVGTAEFITSVSPHYVTKISEFTGKKGYTLLNGYDIPEKYLNPDTYPDAFTITFNGSLYATQPIEPFLEAVKQLIDEGYSEIKLKFPGLGFFPNQVERVKAITYTIENHVEITNRIPKEEVLEIQRKSDILLMISHTNIKGIPSSKLYEYIGLRKEILLYPNDHSIIEETLNDVGLGIICDSKESIYSSLKLRLDNYRNGDRIIQLGNLERIGFYSRANQAKYLAELLDSIESENSNLKSSPILEQEK